MANTVRIPGGHQRIRFGYSGLILSVPDRVRYRYRLDGFDLAWSEPAAAREAVYTNLPPGRYRFRVMATNADGIWNTDEAAVSIEVDPLFWQAWWFRLSVVMLCMACVLAVYRIRLHQLTTRINLRFQERLAERTRIAQELHDTLLQGFLSASMQVHVAADRLPEDSSVKPALTRALELMRRVIDEGRNAVRGLRSSQSASLDLEHAFSRIQQELATGEQMGEEVDFRVIVDGEQKPLHPVLRDEVYRIGREALVNAFRHAQARKIEMELKYSSNRLRVLVRDDGCGIDPNVLQSGRDGHWGLSGMRERADRIGAQFHVMSSSFAGTEIELSIPGSVAFQASPNNKFRWFDKYSRRRAAARQTPSQNGKS
jgi:signal transduction histidine kinase